MEKQPLMSSRVGSYGSHTDERIPMEEDDEANAQPIGLEEVNDVMARTATTPEYPLESLGDLREWSETSIREILDRIQMEIRSNPKGFDDQFLLLWYLADELQTSKSRKAS